MPPTPLLPTPFLGALVAVLSVASGLTGYKFAVTQEPAGVGAYILVLAAGLVLQLLLATLASHRKDAWLQRCARAPRPWRVDLCVVLAWCLAALAVPVGAVALWVSREAGEMALYAGMICAGCAFQFASFAASSRALVLEPVRFWSGQLAGAAVRLLATLVLVMQLELAYAGILLANGLAAAAIGRHFASWPVVSQRRLKAAAWCVRTGRLRRAMTWDGALRGARPAYESLAFTACVWVCQHAALLGSAALQASWVAVGYLNTLATGLRQSLSRWERAPVPSPSVARQSRGSLAGLAASGLVAAAAAAVAVAAQHQLGAFDLLLPSLPQAARDQIVWTCAAVLAAYPLTRGFLYSDYQAPRELRRQAARLGLALPGAGLLVAGVLLLAGDAAAPLLFLPVPLSIAWALRGRRA